MADLTLDQLQERVDIWHRHHFPTVDTTRIVLKLVEEVGELCKAREQQMALGGDIYRLQQREWNAIGDVLVCLAALCARENYDLESLVLCVLAEIESRSHERIVGA